MHQPNTLIRQKLQWPVPPLAQVPVKRPSSALIISDHFGGDHVTVPLSSKPFSAGHLPVAFYTKATGGASICSRMLPPATLRSVNERNHLSRITVHFWELLEICHQAAPLEW